MKLELNSTPAQIAACYAVMHQLRPNYTEQAFVQQVLAQQGQGYQLLSAIQDEGVVGVAGFVISTKLAWGKHLYVDDLVILQDVRCAGIGSEMLRWLCQYGLKQQCREVHLDSGVQRFGAHRFYLREGFHIASHHFTLGLSD